MTKGAHVGGGFRAACPKARNRDLAGFIFGAGAGIGLRRAGARDCGGAGARGAWCGIARACG